MPAYLSRLASVYIVAGNCELNMAEVGLEHICSFNSLKMFSWLSVHIQGTFFFKSFVNRAVLSAKFRMNFLSSKIF